MASKKTVIVTGTSYDIGAAVVRPFAAETSLQPRAALPRSASRESPKHIHVSFIPDLVVLESTRISAAGMAFGLIAAYGLLWFARAPMEPHFGLWRWSVSRRE